MKTRSVATALIFALATVRMYAAAAADILSIDRVIDASTYIGALQITSSELRPGGDAASSTCGITYGATLTANIGINELPARIEFVSDANLKTGVEYLLFLYSNAKELASNRGVEAAEMFVQVMDRYRCSLAMPSINTGPVAIALEIRKSFVDGYAKQFLVVGNAEIYLPAALKVFGERHTFCKEVERDVNPEDCDVRAQFSLVEWESMRNHIVQFIAARE